jgi:type IV secretory pathway VirJ component
VDEERELGVPKAGLRGLVVAAVALGAVLMGPPGAPPARAGEATLEFGRFGVVHVYAASERPQHVVLFASGDGGWNLGVVDMARALAQQDALVAGVDVPAYLKRLGAADEPCSYPAGDFEALGQWLQKRYEYPTYGAPVLVGYSSGATLVYATLAQAPPPTFRGGISLGFCPDLPLRKPFCKGEGLKSIPRPDGKGVNFLPAPGLATPWIAFQGEIDQVCDPTAVARFAGETGQARVVMLPHVGHGFSVQRNWMPQFRQAFATLVADTGPRPAPASGLENLPLVEVPAAHPGKTFAVIVSGDGGWASIDRSVAEALAGDGIPTVGLDSLRYFWTRRTPDEAGRDLARIVDHYMAAWGMERVILVGYSRGADVLPFMASRLRPELAERTALVALLGVRRAIDFEVRLRDFVPATESKGAFPVRPEIAKLAGRKVLCIYGSDEPDPLCPELDRTQVTVVAAPGGHHFGGDYKALAERIVRAAH